MAYARIGVIGGTGLYSIEGMKDLKDVRVKTPFGDPSDSIVVGELNGISIAFLPRHGRKHTLAPDEVPVKANIYALKSLGVEHIVGINSCGSFKEDIKPGDLVIPDQLIDRTRGRVGSFFGKGLVAHISFAQPFCPVLSDVLYNSARESGSRVHKNGVCLVMEGPAFSTAAESRLYKSWGADIINMTLMPEAKLAREAEICYATVACVSDYDSWRQEGAGEHVRVDMVVAVMQGNIGNAKRIIKLAAPNIPAERKCGCADALRTALITPVDYVPKSVKKELALFVGKYLPS